MRFDRLKPELAGRLLGGANDRLGKGSSDAKAAAKAPAMNIV